MEFMLTDDQALLAPPRDTALLPVGGASRRFARLRYPVAATDVLSFELALILAWLVRRGFQLRNLPVASPRLFVLAMVLQVFVFASFRLYHLTQLSAAEEFRRILIAVTVTVGLLVIAAFWSRTHQSRELILLTWMLGILFVMASRRLWHVHVGRAREKGTLAFRTLAVGTNAEAEHLRDIMRRPALGYRLVGFVSTDQQGATRVDGLPVYGTIDQLQEAIERAQADCVFVMSSAVDVRQMERVSRAVRLAGVEVRISANISNILSSRLSLNDVGGVMVLSLRPVKLSGAQAALKRTLDVLISTTALIISVPLWLLIAAAIKIGSPGPVLYRQGRVGLRSHPFVMLKFRTMIKDADARLDSLRSMNEATGPLFKLRTDPRITRVGQWLRKWSLDELPQLLNVLKGDMSLVGPRPALPNEVAQYEDWHRDRLAVRPGITGLWQVKGRSELPFDDYVRMDLFYIENWSVAYDLFILAKTFPAVLSGKGAY